MKEERALEVVRPTYDVVDISDYAMSVDAVVKQVAQIQDIMERVLKKDVHYGTIPGCPKPSLYKPGAEILSVTFRLAPAYEIKRTDLPNGHREYEVVCTLKHLPTGQVFAQGVGSCTTMEARYRYRDNIVFTGKPVPSAYWKGRSTALLGGKGFKAKKNPETDQWEIAKVEGKVEYDNPADYYNTVLKVGKKRSHIDAVLTATATSDIFTQDHPEDPEPNGQTDKKKTPDKPPADSPMAQSAELGKKQQIARLQNKLNTNGIPQYRFEECIGNPLKDVNLAGLTAMLDFWEKTQEKYEAWLSLQEPPPSPPEADATQKQGVDISGGIDPAVAQALSEATGGYNADMFWRLHERGLTTFFDTFEHVMATWPQPVQDFIYAKCKNISAKHPEFIERLNKALEDKPSLPLEGKQPPPSAQYTVCPTGGPYAGKRVSYMAACGNCALNVKCEEYQAYLHAQKQQGETLE